jgi:ABC-type protease/lipase transport system fused ATPase/permease subunit
MTIAGSGIHAIFDLPWAPIYIAVIFVLHPLLGAFALGCSITLVLMATLFNEWIVKPPLAESNETATRSYTFTEMSLRNTEVLRAMGMTAGLLRRWSRDRILMIERQVSRRRSLIAHSNNLMTEEVRENGAFPIQPGMMMPLRVDLQARPLLLEP